MNKRFVCHYALCIGVHLPNVLSVGKCACELPFSPTASESVSEGVQTKSMYKTFLSYQAVLPLGGIVKVYGL